MGAYVPPERGTGPRVVDLFKNGRLGHVPQSEFALDHFKSEHNAVDDGFGLGRAAGHVDVHGDHMVHAAHDVVAVLKHAARAGAGADGDDGLGFGHLVVKVFEDVLVALVHGAGDEQHVGVLGIADVHDAEAFDVEDGREAGQHFNVAPVAGTAVVMDYPRGLQTSLVDVLIQFFMQCRKIHGVPPIVWASVLADVEPEDVEDGQAQRDAEGMLEHPAPRHTRADVVDDDFERVGQHEQDDHAGDAGVPEQGAQAEQQDDVEPVGDFEQRELGAGIVGQHAAHDFLMPVVTGGDVEGRLGELDGQRVAERDEQERQVRQQRHVESVDVGDHEAAGGGGHAHEGEDDQRLVGEHLEQFALRAHVAVGRVGGKRAGHLEHRADRHDEEQQQHVALHEEHEQGNGRSHETDVGREDEPRVGHARGFPEELQDVVEGLEQRRTLPGLETGRQASVHPGEKSARGNGYSDCDEGENELQH